MDIAKYSLRQVANKAGERALKEVTRPYDRYTAFAPFPEERIKLCGKGRRKGSRSPSRRTFRNMECASATSGDDYTP